MPAVGVHVTLLRLDVGDAPIRMTQALTDADGRVRDLLERPLAAGDYRLEFDVAREDGTFFTKVSVDLRITDVDAQLSRPAAARALFDDDLPGQLSRPGLARCRLAHQHQGVEVEPRVAAAADDDELDRVRAARRPARVSTTTRDLVVRSRAGSPIPT